MTRESSASDVPRSRAALAAVLALTLLQACNLRAPSAAAGDVVGPSIPSEVNIPLTAPDPSGNLALHKPATASASMPDQPPTAAVDGDPETAWSAGTHPTQWIEIDLGATYDLDRLILTVAQTPAGNTVHQVFGRGDEGNYRLLHEFRGDTSDGQLLDVAPMAAWDAVRYLKIETSESPSWVAWREIAVFGRAAGPSSVSRSGDAMVAMPLRTGLAWMGR
ncbi:MAG TPA: discoidin domain-containing protein [Anaerolineales bacterium]|nr:discoidin domain-containing protein [Anaerolineales bacterium]